MGRRGPPPKPTAIRRLEGNPGKRPLNACEPVPTAATPRRPAEVTGRAKREWDLIIPELKRLGVLASCDRVALSGYAVSAGQFFDLTHAIAEQGGEWSTGPDGRVTINPLAAARDRAQRSMLRWCQEFGLSPSSRSRVVADAEKATVEDDPGEAFFRDRQRRLHVVTD